MIILSSLKGKIIAFLFGDYISISKNFSNEMKIEMTGAKYIPIINFGKDINILSNTISHSKAITGLVLL